MPPNQNRIRIRIHLHGLFQTLPQILLMRRIFDNWDAQAIVVPQITLFTTALGDTLDLLNLLDFETCRGAGVAFNEEGDEDGPLRVRVDAAAGAALEGSEEERGAG